MLAYSSTVSNVQSARREPLRACVRLTVYLNVLLTLSRRGPGLRLLPTIALLGRQMLTNTRSELLCRTCVPILTSYLPDRALARIKRCLATVSSSALPMP